jgi:hypothetical protein
MNKTRKFFALLFFIAIIQVGQINAQPLKKVVNDAFDFAERQKNMKSSRVFSPDPLKMVKTFHRIQDGGVVGFFRVLYGIFLSIAKIKIY